ncbi:alpha/beta fold hydrolase [Mycobacterium montefiorense]|nr:alpha/beta hydrolase [Mycobacterium montefiorense]
MSLSSPDRDDRRNVAQVMADSMLFVEANGVRFACLDEGSGPLVLMLHGFPDTAHSWDQLRPRIAAKGYRVVSPYMRGYDPSGIPDRDPDQETLARDPLALIEALGARDAIVIGHDWGASAAYGAAALAPDRVTRLFVIGIPHPAALKPTLRKAWGVRHFVAYKLPGAAKRFARNDFAALPAIYRRWSPLWNPDPGEFDAVRASFANPASLHAAFGYYRKLSPLPSASLKTRIKVPTVAFAGLDDPVAEPSDYRGAARMFEGEYIVEEVPGGHFMHREHPEEFTDRLLTYL